MGFSILCIQPYTDFYSRCFISTVSVFGIYFDSHLTGFMSSPFAFMHPISESYPENQEIIWNKKIALYQLKGRFLI